MASEFRMPDSYYNPPEYPDCDQCGGTLDDDNDCTDCGEHTLTDDECAEIRAEMRAEMVDES